MEIRRSVERRFDAKSKTFDPSKRVEGGFNPDRFVEEKFNPEVRVESVEDFKDEPLHHSIFVDALIGILNQIGNAIIDGTKIKFSTGEEHTLSIDLTDFPSVKVGNENYFVEISGAGVLELALYIVRKYNYIGRRMNYINKVKGE